MKIQDLYKKYDIMPLLATHQLRVGGVAKIISDSWQDRDIARRAVVASLIHDMGNIVKFDLSKPMTPIDNLPYWTSKQKEYWERYGREAHEATYAILREAGLTRYIPYLEEEGRLYNAEEARPDFGIASREALMVLYADLRVIPSGVVTMQERVEDLARRYGNDRPESRWATDLAKYVQTLTPISLGSIDESMVAPLFDELLTYTI